MTQCGPKSWHYGWCDTQNSQTHHSHFPVLRPFSWIKPNCRTPGTLLEPWAMGRLAGDQEPIGKMVSCPRTIHPWWFVGAGSLGRTIIYSAFGLGGVISAWRGGDLNPQLLPACLVLYLSGCGNARSNYGLPALLVVLAEEAHGRTLDAGFRAW
jgi:hypothetical protein